MGALHHPDWFDHQFDYELPRYAYALQMGRDAALALKSDWPEAEVMLRGIWRQEPGGLTWGEARGAVYSGWLEVKHRVR